MTAKILNESAVWKEFEAEARRRRRNPFKLLSDYMKDCLEIWEHERLDEEISREAQKSGYTEKDAVELVKRYRLEKQPRAAS